LEGSYTKAVEMAKTSQDTMSLSQHDSSSGSLDGSVDNSIEMDDGSADSKVNPIEYAANTAKLASSIADLEEEKPDPSI